MEIKGKFWCGIFMVFLCFFFYNATVSATSIASVGVVGTLESHDFSVLGSEEDVNLNVNLYSESNSDTPWLDESLQTFWDNDRMIDWDWAIFQKMTTVYQYNGNGGQFHLNYNYLIDYSLNNELPLESSEIYYRIDINLYSFHNSTSGGPFGGQEGDITYSHLPVNGQEWLEGVGNISNSISGAISIDVNLTTGMYYQLDTLVYTFTKAGYHQSAAPVPEPTTLLLLGSGLAGLVGFRRKLKIK